jgi:hypothetical protein
MQLANQDVAIRTRAYAIWEEEGRPDGRDWEHWCRAAQEVAAHEPAPTTTAAAARPRKAAGAKGKLRRALKSALS